MLIRQYEAAVTFSGSNKRRVATLLRTLMAAVETEGSVNRYHFRYAKAVGEYLSCTWRGCRSRREKDSRLCFGHQPVSERRQLLARSRQDPEVRAIRRALGKKRRTVNG